MKYFKFLAAFAATLLFAGCAAVQSVTDSVSSGLNSSMDDSAKKKEEQQKLVKAQCGGQQVATIMVIESENKEFAAAVTGAPPAGDMVMDWNEVAGNCFKVGISKEKFNKSADTSHIKGQYYILEVSYGFGKRTGGGGVAAGGGTLGGFGAGGMGFDKKEIGVSVRVYDSRERDFPVKSITLNPSATDVRFGAIAGTFLGMFGLGGFGAIAGNFDKQTPEGKLVIVGVFQAMNEVYDAVRQRGGQVLQQPGVKPAAVNQAPATQQDGNDIKPIDTPAPAKKAIKKKT